MGKLIKNLNDTGDKAVSWDKRFEEYLKSERLPSYYINLAKTVQNNIKVDIESIVSTENLDSVLTKINSYTQAPYNTKKGRDNLKTVARHIKIFNLDRLNVTDDVVAISNDSNLNDSEKRTLIEARIGQGKYRKEVLSLYKEKCVISGISVLSVLIASHVKAWKKCQNRDEQTSKYNGLLLSANYDKLFDNYLISFDENGKIMINDSLSDSDRKALNINEQIKINLHKKTIPFMESHREEFFKKTKI